MASIATPARLPLRPSLTTPRGTDRRSSLCWRRHCQTLLRRIPPMRMSPIRSSIPLGPMEPTTCGTTCGMSTTQSLTEEPSQQSHRRKMLRSKSTAIVRDRRHRATRQSGTSAAMVAKNGRKKWKRVSGYHRRSLAETAVYRFKQLMGRFVEARKWENEKVEVRLKAKALNRMTRLGMPQTSKVAV